MWRTGLGPVTREEHRRQRERPGPVDAAPWPVRVRRKARRAGVEREVSAIRSRSGEVGRASTLRPHRGHLRSFAFILRAAGSH